MRTMGNRLQSAWGLDIWPEVRHLPLRLGAFFALAFFVTAIPLGCPGCASVNAQTETSPAARPVSSAQATEAPDFNPDRPGLADGSTVVGRGLLQLETGLQQEQHKDGLQKTRVRFVPTLLRYGLNDRWEARIESNAFSQARTSDPVTGVSRTSGFSPLSLGLKYHFQDQPDGSMRPSLGAIFRLFPQSGSSDFRSTRTTGDLRLAADWEFAPQWSLNPNVGVGIYEDDQGKTFATGLAALTLNYVNRAKTLNPFIDMGFQSSEAGQSKSSLIVDTGIAYIIGGSLQLDLSVGTGVKGRTPPRPFVAAGISKRF